MSSVTLLGPQSPTPNLKEALDAQGIEEPLAVISAGWEERESEQDELTSHVGRETRNLRLHARFEAVLQADRPLQEALVDRNDRLQTMQMLYRRQLHSSIEAVWELHDLKVQKMDLVVLERDQALGAVTRLDEHYLERVRGIHRAFEDLWDPTNRSALRDARAEVSAEIAECKGLLIAGGHVGVLLDRLRSFGIAEQARERPVFAWSAGAMAVTERVVLFHDSPPQGRGVPEVFDDGLGLAPQVIALPHAKHRLRMSDPVRVGIFARRFHPSTCVAMEVGCGLRWDGEAWEAFGRSRKLNRSGQVVGMVAP